MEERGDREWLFERKKNGDIVECGRYVGIVEGDKENGERRFVSEIFREFEGWVEGGIRSMCWS